MYEKYEYEIISYWKKIVIFKMFNFQYVYISRRLRREDLINPFCLFFWVPLHLKGVVEKKYFKMNCALKEEIT